MTWGQSLRLDKDPAGSQKQSREVSLEAGTLAGWFAKASEDNSGNRCFSSLSAWHREGARVSAGLCMQPLYHAFLLCFLSIARRRQINEIFYVLGNSQPRICMA